MRLFGDNLVMMRCLMKPNQSEQRGQHRSIPHCEDSACLAVPGLQHVRSLASQHLRFRLVDE